jgi:predicted DNA-binding protein YlxM (UPF0122 family)
MATVDEIAKQFNVTKQAVYLWIKAGLKVEMEKVIGRKTRQTITPDDVVKFHKNKEVK